MTLVLVRRREVGSRAEEGKDIRANEAYKATVFCVCLFFLSSLFLALPQEDEERKMGVVLEERRRRRTAGFLLSELEPSHASGHCSETRGRRGCEEVSWNWKPKRNYKVKTKWRKRGGGSNDRQHKYTAERVSWGRYKNRLLYFCVFIWAIRFSLRVCNTQTRLFSAFTWFEFEFVLRGALPDGNDSRPETAHKVMWHDSGMKLTCQTGDLWLSHSQTHSNNMV